MRRLWFPCLCEVILMVISAGWALAAPVLINYQGALTYQDGLQANGPVEMTFSLYDDAQGSLLWSETKTINVMNGFYATTLGDIVSLNLPFDQIYYLGVAVTGDSEMLPRQPLPPASVALHADHAGGLVDGAVTTAMIPDGSIDPRQITASCNAGEILQMTVSGWDCAPAPH